MDLNEAITAHSNWKMKLNRYIRNPDGSIDSGELSANDQCELGKWLKGEGKKHAHLPEFAALVTAHTKFHKAAGDIVHRCNKGEPVSSEVSLSGSSDFSKASMETVSLLMKMKSQI